MARRYANPRDVSLLTVFAEHPRMSLNAFLFLFPYLSTPEARTLAVMLQDDRFAVSGILPITPELERARDSLLSWAGRVNRPKRRKK